MLCFRAITWSPLESVFLAVYSVSSLPQVSSDKSCFLGDWLQQKSSAPKESGTKLGHGKSTVWQLLSTQGIRLVLSHLFFVLQLLLHLTEADRVDFFQTLHQWILKIRICKTSAFRAHIQYMHAFTVHIQWKKKHWPPFCFGPKYYLFFHQFQSDLE